MPSVSRRRRALTRTRLRVAMLLLAALPVAATLAVGCGGAELTCPVETEPLSDAEVDVYRQLEVCASRVTGVALHRDDLPRVESDPELVDCARNSLGKCVVTAAGQAVTGFYLEGCDTFTVVDHAVLLHEMLHPILCGVPELDCDGAHASQAWVDCQAFKGCPDGRIILTELVCDGTADCAQGEDEAGCP